MTPSDAITEVIDRVEPTDCGVPPVLALPATNSPVLECPVCCTVVAEL